MEATSLSEYLDTYGPLVADRARQAFEPLHVPSTDEPIMLDLKRPLFAAQAHVMTAMVKTLQHQKAVFCAAECGVGKTALGICTVHAHAAGRPYRAIVMVPPHLLATWQAELAAIFPAQTVDVWTLDSWSELFLLPRGKLARPLWLLMSETTAKMGPGWRPAVTTDYQGRLCCPTCGAQVRSKAGDGGNPLTLKDLEKSKKRCTAEVSTRDEVDGVPVVRECGAPLWQYADDKPTWAPADYIHKHMRGVFDYLIVDEVHQEKSDSSARANALGALVASCRKVIGMTGTLIGGKASHVRSLLFRMNAKSLRAEDLSWTDSMEFARRYGRVDTIITEKESSGNDNRRSNGKSRTKREQEQPGIMPTLYGRHLIGNTVFLSLKDVAANLPSYEEIPTPISLGAGLSGHYKEMEDKLKDAIKQLIKKGGAMVLLSKMLHALLAWPDYPYDWDEIGYEDHGKDAGPHGRWVHVCQPSTLDSKIIWPKEKALLDILQQERAQGRQVWTFATYTDKHDVLGRLETIIRQAGLRVKVLRAEQVPTKSRSAWIAKHAPGVDVMVSHPQPVGTGMTLFDPRGSHNFSTLAFYETGYDLFALRQASRRSWRIGQKLPCRVHFLYYAETMQARAMGLMAQKLDASLALEGQFSAEGLAAMCSDAGSMQMELAKSLVENIEFGELERVWAKCGENGQGMEPKPEPRATIRDLTSDRPLSPTEQRVLFGEAG